MNVLLTTLGSLGDLHPFLGLGLELGRRGHRVRIATSEYHRSSVEGESIEFLPLRPDLQPDNRELLEAVLHPLRGPETLHKKFIFPYLEEALEDFLPHVRGTDLIVSGILSYYAPIASALHSVPWVSCLLSPICFFSSYDPPLLAPFPFLGRARFLGPRFHSSLLKLMLFAAGSWAGPLRELRRKHGLPPGGNPFRSFSPRLVLAPFSEIFAKKQRDWPPQAEMTGFIFHDGPTTETALAPALETFLQAGPPPLIFTLGSTAVLRPGDLFDSFAQTARLLRMRAILLVGRTQVETFRSLASPELFVGDYARYSLLFPRGALTIHQGGVGTTGQAMRAGRPMLILPACMDQYDNAERAKRAGVAEVLPARKFAPRRAAERIRRILSKEGMTLRAAEVGSALQAEHGPARAAEALERFVAAWK